MIGNDVVQEVPQTEDDATVYELVLGLHGATFSHPITAAVYHASMIVSPDSHLGTARGYAKGIIKAIRHLQVDPSDETVKAGYSYDEDDLENLASLLQNACTLLGVQWALTSFLYRINCG